MTQRRRTKPTAGKPGDVKVQVVPIASLTQDPENVRKHNPRNVGFIEDSIQAVGAARSGVVDEDGKILVGNGMQEAAMGAGLTEAIIVETDGQRPVFVRRSGLTNDQKTRLAVSDNKASDLSDFDPKLLHEIMQKYPAAKSGWTEHELDNLLKGNDPNRTVLEQGVQLEPAREFLVVMCAPGEDGRAEWEQLRSVFGLGLIRRGGYKHGSMRDEIGVQRVVLADAVLKRVTDVDRDSK